MAEASSANPDHTASLEVVWSGSSLFTILNQRPVTEVIKLCSCSTQVSMKIIMLINVKMPTILSIITLISMINTSESLKANKVFIFSIFVIILLFFIAWLSWAWTKFYNLEPDNQYFRWEQYVNHKFSTFTIRRWTLPVYQFHTTVLSYQVPWKHPEYLYS